MYTIPYSMLLNHIAIQNYFKNYSKFKIFPIKNTVSGQRLTGQSTASISGLIGRPDRSTVPVDRALWLWRARLCTSAGRPDRSTD